MGLVARPPIGAERVDKLFEAFGIFDADGSGSISAQELAMVMRELDHDVTPQQILEMMAEVDLDGSGTIDYEEFKALMVSERGDREARLRVAFEVLDASGTGKIDLADLEPVMIRFGLGSDELEQMIAVVDGDGDGSLDFEEFAALMPDEAAPGTYRSSTPPTPVTAPDYVHDPSRFEHQTLQEDAAAGNEEALERLQSLLKRQADDWQTQRRGTSLLQLQTGVFRLIQGAAYRCFRESFSANYETHLRVRNLPYRITEFVEFARLTLEIYKALGVVDEACFPVIDAVNQSLAVEYERLNERIANWDTIPKTPEMVAEARRMQAASAETQSLREKFAAGVEFAIALRKNRLGVRDAVEGVLAIHELNRLRRLDLNEELAPSEQPPQEGDPRAYLARWNRVILEEAGEQVPGAMMPVAYWYEEFMPLLLAAMSVSKAEDVADDTAPDEAALDAWYRETQASGEFERYGDDVAQHFPACSPARKLAVRQAWRLTRRYLNGVQKRREREEAGRETGALSQYVAFLDIYLGRSDVKNAEMRVSFPYYIGPAVWRLLHTSAEILCTMSLERQKLGLELFVAFFKLFATMYPCPYCRHHLNEYVVRNREISMYPLEYLMLGHDPKQTELVMDASDKLKAVSSGEDLRLFFWKLHNTVNASIARSESWYRPDERAFYTTRYWPSLDSELARAEALRHVSLATERIARIYGLLRPAARIAGLRSELRHVLESRDEDDLRRIWELSRKYVAELERAVVTDGNFLQEAYHFDPDRVDPPPDFSPEEERFARSGVYTE